MFETVSTTVLGLLEIYDSIKDINRGIKS